MPEFRGFCRTRSRWVLPFLALAAALLASACAPGSSSRLTGVGCADPSCNEVMPETRKVLGCIGEACNEPPPPSAAKKVASTASEERDTQSPPAASTTGEESDTQSPPAAGTTGEESDTQSPPVAASGTDSSAAPEAETDADVSSGWGIKVYYEPHNRP